MWFSATPFKICFSTTMFYSIFLVSKCRSDDIPGGTLWKYYNKDGSLQIYVSEVPLKPVDLEDSQRNHSAFVAWIAVLSVVLIVIVIVTCVLCICCTVSPKRSSRRQFSNAALVAPSSRTLVMFQNHHNDNMGVRYPQMRTGNVYSRGVVNFSFTNNDGDTTLPMELDDRPPDYSTVVTDNSTNDRLINTLHSQISETKKVETPPPAYITIDPFENSSKIGK